MPNKDPFLYSLLANFGKEKDGVHLSKKEDLPNETKVQTQSHVCQMVSGFTHYKDRQPYPRRSFPLTTPKRRVFASNLPEQDTLRAGLLGYTPTRYTERGEAQ